MIRKISTILLLIVILTSLFIAVFSSVVYANRPNYTVCWRHWAKIQGKWCDVMECCTFFSSYYGGGLDKYCTYTEVWDCWP